MAGTMLCASAALSAERKLTIYTAFYPEWLEKHRATIEALLPDTEIDWLRDSTGVIAARAMAEGENTPADMIWGIGATSLMQFTAAGMTHAYAPKGLERIAPQFRDKADPPGWVGMDAWVGTVCFNTVVAEEKGLPKPESWQDLTDPVYKGEITMPSPASSGTGFFHVASWLQIFGEEGGWAFMDALHPNVAQYTHSGSKPCRQAAAGEFAVGISFAFRGAKLKQKGAPIDLIYPAEGVGWDMDAFVILKSSKNIEDAKVIADWSVSEDANERYNEEFAIVAIPEIAKPVEHMDPAILEKMIDNDFDWMATNYTRIIKTWESKYGSKTEAE